MLSQTEAISGLGGIGKTQTALEYAHRYRENYGAVLWVTAETEQTLNTGFSDIARILELAEKDGDPYQRKAIVHWLQSQQHWLLIFDNADNPDLLRDFLPRQHRGDVLLTSRARVFDSLGLFIQPIELEELSSGDARSFLLHRTGRNLPDEDELRAADSLALELGYLPLALEQAAAYMFQRGTRFQDYLVSFRKRRLELLERQHPAIGNYSHSVVTTWIMNFNELKTIPASVELLCLSGFLAPEDIPLDLLAPGFSHFEDSIGKAAASYEEDPLSLDDVMEPLLRYSLVQRHSGDLPVFTIHRLTQAVIQQQLGPEIAKEWAERAVFVLSYVYPFSDTKGRQRLLSHAQKCAEWVEKWNMQFGRAAFLLTELGSDLTGHANYTEAEPLLRRAVAISEIVTEMTDEAQLGLKALCLQSLALLCRTQGHHAEAELLLRRALTITETIQGGRGRQTLIGLNGLGEVLRDQGRYDEAEPLLVRALAITETLKKPEDVGAASILYNLAMLRRDQGNYTEAEQLIRRALAINEAVLGPQHAATLTLLALIYRDQGCYIQAEPLLRRALDIDEASLTSQHPGFASTLNNLGELYRRQGRYAEAEPLLRRALAIHESTYGPHHPETAVSLHCLGQLLRDLGHYAQSEPLLRRALQIRETTYGFDHHHPDVAATLKQLRNVLGELGRYGGDSD